MEKPCSNASIYSNYSQILDCLISLNQLERNLKEELFLQHIETVLTYVIISIGLPLTLVAIYGVLSLVRTDNEAPIYIVNLLVSDLIQFCCMIASVVAKEKTYEDVHLYSLIVSCGFMLCISVKRYLVIAWPLWYHFRRSVKTSVVACVVVWTLPLLFFALIFFISLPTLRKIMAVLIFLLLPVQIFTLVGTQRALSAASRVPTDEKRRIMALLILVLLTYILLLLPIAPQLIIGELSHLSSFVCKSLIKLNPIADLFLYFFLRKGVVDTLLAHVCCCRLRGDDVVST
ncbi:mas-related G-protein coupled receptor member X4-like [Solea solea]|uniref:mas-related G-protein coupled receptor member X4-like n=1 Tax=Solea solea TaxID=90069 RepID=UPI002729D9B8|nr:mas-related G-protein coupled receptor member X4-like [Solea solea]